MVTMTDELARRQGNLDLDALAQALGVLGVPAFAVIAHRGLGIAELREQRAVWPDWSTPAPAPAPPTEPAERDAWVESVLASRTTGHPNGTGSPSVSTVTVRLGGSCHRCPAAWITLHQRLERRLRRRHPGLREVRHV
ncbi:NifU family protein [Streptomyces sp. CME 23]|nr:NifU family protein [Streptomyces sp. CME 23]